jgi:hypothetical protein
MKITTQRSEFRYRGYRARSAAKVLARAGLSPLGAEDEPEPDDVACAGPSLVEEQSADEGSRSTPKPTAPAPPPSKLDHDRFFHGDKHLEAFADALGMNVDGYYQEPGHVLHLPYQEWHDNIMPKALHKEFGNRGCFMVQDAAHRHRLHYVTMWVTEKDGKTQTGKKHSFELPRLFALIHGVDPHQKLSPAALWLWRALLLVAARLLKLPPRAYRVPTVAALASLSTAQEWRAAMKMLDLIGTQVQLCQLQPDSHLIHHSNHNGTTVPLVLVSNQWLACWCYEPLRELCGPKVSRAQLAAVAGELRSHLFRSGFLWRERNGSGYWYFGPAPCDARDGRGLVLQDLLEHFPKLVAGKEPKR